MPKQDVRSNPGRFAAGCAMGAAVTLILSAVLLLLPAALIASGRVGEGSAMTFAYVSAFAASCAGALTARIKNKGGALLSCLGASLAAVLVRLAITLLSDRSTAIDSGDIGVCAAILAGGVLMGLISGGRRRRRR